VSPCGANGNETGLPFTGEFQWIQFAGPLYRSRTGGGNIDNVGPCYGLDTFYPYPKHPPPFAADTTSDSPATTLGQGYSAYSRSDAFTMTLMFKPDWFSGATWVPLSKVDWSWAVAATSSNNGASWSITSKTPAGTWPAGTLSPGATTDFPEWSGTSACPFP